MIRSAFIKSLLELLTNDDPDCSMLQKQFLFLSEFDHAFTGSGSFISFSHEEDIKTYRIFRSSKVITGIKIRSAELTADADAVLYINNGLIEHLEIHSEDGNYPETELTNYELLQAWKVAANKVVQS